MAVSREYLDYLLESLAPLGRVVAKRMFGGTGLFLDGLMFAIVIDDQLWLKADDRNRAEFTALDLP
ncbi:MAG: TfoX/Sxy family protein, partial [Betaproteobacteria bacterium]|nr:TfoX/Sxy family protein [Betaproteobacteria bacterium]